MELKASKTIVRSSLGIITTCLLVVPVTTLAAQDDCALDCAVSSNDTCDNKDDCSKLRFQGGTTFIPRSQGANTARELVGWQRQLYRSYDTNYAVVASSIEYTRSFGTECLAQRLFSTNYLTFEGSEREKRSVNAIVADYFGLSTTYKGTLAIKPLIQNVIIDINLYFGLDGWVPGLYMRINAPIVHTKWTLGLDDCIHCDDKFRGCTVFPDCYMFTCDEDAEGKCRIVTPIQDEGCPTPNRPPTDPATPRQPVDCPVNPNLNTSRVYRNGDCTTQNIRDALSGLFTFGDMTEPWKFGRFSFCTRDKTGIADIDVSVGYNFLQSDYAHAGLFGALVIPTGNRPKGRYIFEPIVGDGRHWKLGGGFSGHWSLYPYDDDMYFNTGLYIQGRVVHMFKTDQVRSFDFRGDQQAPTHLLTRYILLKEYNTAFNYNGTMINAINFATRNCEVSVGAMIDLSLKAFVSLHCWQFDIGYNFYFRHKEKVCIKTECPCPIDSRIFAIKGLQGVCCRNQIIINDEVTKNYVATPLNKADNDATMFDPQLPTTAELTDTTVCLSWNSKPVKQNIPVDDFENEKFLQENGFILADLSTQEEFVTCADLDPASAAQGEMKTNKIFGHVSYTFEESLYTPNIGIGAEGEFDACNNNALQQWGIWLKGGVTF